MLFLLHAPIPPSELRGGDARAAQSAAAHALLDGLLQRLGMSEEPRAKNEHGRPYLKHRSDVDFNLSHTAALAVCALLCDTSAQPRVGVDAEELVSYSEEKLAAFSARFFAPCEQQYVAGSITPREAFTRVFVRKEAYAKYRGDGLGMHLRNTDTLAPDFEQNHGVRFLTYREQDTFITLCLPQTCREQPQTALLPLL
ncbi:MAG: 4'-phosphopantetheinyl transferase superfamily protein [Clostridia bacterium]|nr:4'-phosphopantetheinyl transferase superfamily protein [Clostridia bacterium]